MTLTDIKTILILLLMFGLPGWAFLGLTGDWKRWNGLQRWCVAIAIGIVFYPLLFYWARDVLPGLHLGSRKLLVILAIFAALILWRFWKNGRVFIDLSQSEWIAVAIFGATVFTRLWVAYLYPYPAWSDSLHHTLLTQLTAQDGQLPRSLEPYEPVMLNMYHLGLHAITGSLQILAGIPAYKALLLAAQLLNGLCGLGVYLVLDRKVGRTAAIVGAVVVGLLSLQPAWYVNWGRFTQVSSQAVMLIAWLVTWEAIASWRQSEQGWRNRSLLGVSLSSLLLTAGVFLLHYRVAGFYLPLLLITVAWEFYQGYRTQTLKPMLVGTAVIGVLSILLTAPALVQALAAFIQSRLQSMAAGARMTDNPFYQVSLEAHFTVGFQPWLFAWGILCALVGVLRKNFFTFFLLLWVAFLWMAGNLFRFNIPLISFTNYGAVIIGYYMPLSLIIGTGMQELLRLLPSNWKPLAQQGGLLALLFLGFVGSHYRETGIEHYRHFMTTADEVAMVWINHNLPPDAVFAINSHYWSSSYHGMDGGYWIPYFTNRKTNTGTMLHPLASPDYRSWLKERSETVVSLGTDPAAARALCNLNVDYAYLGANTLFPGATLTPEVMSSIAGAELIYDQYNVKIYRICER